MSSCPLCPLEAEKPVKSKVSKVDKGQGKEKGDKGMNATQACIRAGYKVENARQQATENLSKPYIAESIERAMAERSKRTGIKAVSKC